MRTSAWWVFIGVLAACAEAGDGPRRAAVDAVFDDIDPDGPGAAVGIMMDGETVHRAGYGLAHLEHGIPITPETVFDIASISKQFGAMAALLLEADGALDLDRDVRTWVPELPDFGHVITARHLIHHTSGIRDWPHTMALGGVEMSDVISFEKILRMLFDQDRINFAPGSEYAYSNTGYNLLALVIERVSGQTFREFTHERIFVPLGMDDTHFSDDYNEIVLNRAQSYAPTDSAGQRFARRTNQLTALASSSLHTTVDDFFKWMHNYETGMVGGRTLVDRMVNRGVLTNGDTIGYAAGLSVGTYRGLRTFGHGGSWAGFRTNFVRFPDQNLSVAVFCNFSTCDPARRAREAAAALIGDMMVAPDANVAGASGADDEGKTVAQMREYEGAYRSGEIDSQYRVVLRDGDLVAEHWRNGPSTLSPVQGDTFRGDSWYFPDVTFTRDGAGRIDGFTVTGARVRALRFDRMR